MSECRENLHPGNLSCELYRFRCQIWRFALKKLKLIRDPPPYEDGPLRKNLKHKIEEDNKPC